MAGFSSLLVGPAACMHLGGTSGGLHERCCCDRTLALLVVPRTKAQERGCVSYGIQQYAPQKMLAINYQDHIHIHTISFPALERSSSSRRNKSCFFFLSLRCMLFWTGRHGGCFITSQPVGADSPPRGSCVCLIAVAGSLRPSGNAARNGSSLLRGLGGA